VFSGAPVRWRGARLALVESMPGGAYVALAENR
jgi:hypothetical protein